MRITILGIGEAFDPDRPNSASLVEHDGFTLLIDCGHSVVSPLWRARPDPDAVDAVFLTHHHADHVLGLPPVLDRWSWDGRTKELLVVASPAGQTQMQQICTLLEIAPRFPIRYARADDVPALGPFAMRTAPTQHFVPNLALQLKTDRACFAYSGDGRPTDAARALYAEADLLFHECFYGAPTPEDRCHSDVDTIRSIDGPGRIGLYHVKSNDRARLATAIAADPRLFLLDPGDAIDL